jgi:predicted N-formylglutamate amidohydrolase
MAPEPAARRPRRPTQRPPRFLVTCEHAGHRLPRPYAPRFRRHGLLTTHRGWDPGALRLAAELAAVLRCPLHVSTTTRLLVDLNRSLDNPACLGPDYRSAPPEVVGAILRDHYHPYRAAVERDAAALARRAPVIHVSVHSFTPVLRGQRRDVDVGLLYDPRRPRERRLCTAWKAALALADPALKVRMNRPYAGTADGFTTYLRTRLPDPAYAGVELEVNQRFVRDAGPRWQRLRATLIGTLIIAASV